MPEIRTALACARCQVYWRPDIEQPRCTEADHEHRLFEVHLHRDVVTLPDASMVTATSFDPGNPYSRDRVPDYGLYFDPRWQPPWPHGHVDWPDFGGPDSPEALARALASLLERARSGELVELGCIGGHGRTGTALACLVVLTGLASDRAVEWVRTSYCGEAIETAAQEHFVRSTWPRYMGR